MHLQIMNIFTFAFFAAALVWAQSSKNGNREHAEPEVDWEVARQNRITQQILQYYLERKLFPQLKRPPLSRVPSPDEILARQKKRFNYDKIELLLNATRRREAETLQSVESERVTSVYDKEENWIENTLDFEGGEEDCPNCIDDSTSPASTRWTMPLLKLGDKRYYLGIFFKANYFRATQFCRFHGMHLASISSQEENDKLEKYIKDFGLGNEHFWTSGTDLADEGKFFWMSNGRPLTFTNWNAGEPNNFVYENGEEENCLELWNRDGKGLKWNDSPCSFETFFVCEIQQ
ncbi:hypothetical protein PPYR_15656 [Photinus pyralis]|uniref:C-type lectin domain-containing protein n=3 Tax=Photinus pyralis TaxID=7054 RepID=A0A5N4A0A8_PHOPY|nr:C-type lectin domain family 4 member A-like [Photinus pyralis]KAB0790751.1 hypothetical protein PPYR_15656 [Photinus pyralis]